MVILERVMVRFPQINTEFTDHFASLIGVLGQNENHVLKLTRSSHDFYPELSIDFYSRESDILTDFILSDHEVVSVKIENSTGLSKQSPHAYRLVSVETVEHRLAASEIKLIEIDHVGFNLPWFSSGLHPRIRQLREKLSSQCLYHRFPTGEAWDFILPGDVEEIAIDKVVDYTKVRKPKFELVSFDKSSTPLVQFDISVNVGYERFSQLFPEALHDPEFRNIWVYLQSPYAVDVCLVINESAERDWSDFFKGYRIEGQQLA